MHLCIPLHLGINRNIFIYHGLANSNLVRLEILCRKDGICAKSQNRLTDMREAARKNAQGAT
jgi:hypothetical protein